MLRGTAIRRRGRIAAAALLGSIVLVLAIATAASASPPVIFTATLTVPAPDPNDVNFECGPYGYDFDVLSSFTVTRHFIQFYDNAGNLTKEIRHIQFTGTLYRSDDLSKTIPYAGNWTRTMDVAAGTVKNAGLARYSHPDGSGMVSMDAGLTIIELPDFDLAKDTGQLGPEYESGVCAYLAAA
jgi:hypothetical protein